MYLEINRLIALKKSGDELGLQSPIGILNEFIEKSKESYMVSDDKKKIYPISPKK